MNLMEASVWIISGKHVDEEVDLLLQVTVSHALKY